MSSSPTPTRTSEPPPLALGRLAAVLLVGVMAVVFDTTIVNVAIHRLVSDLHASVGSTQWVVTGFVLALALVVPVSGWASRRFGSKQVWMFSLALFGAGSVLCSLAWSLDALIAFRVVQGIGGGLMLPLLQTLLVQAAGDRPLGKVMSTVSLPVACGPILGPVIGGVIVSSLSWRWIFWVNVPLCVAGLLLAWRELPPTLADRDTPRLDVLGLALLTPALAGIIDGLSEIGVRGGVGHASVLVPLIAGAVLLAVFAAYALGARAPVVDLRLFTHRSFSVSAALLFLSGISLYGAMLLLPLYYQEVRADTPLMAGLLLAPQGLGMLLTRGIAGRLSDRLGPRPAVVAGFLLAVLGSLPFVGVGTHTNLVLLCAGLVVRGAGLGLVLIPVMAAAYADVPREQTADASSATRILNQLGGSFGTAVLAVILQAELRGARGAGAVATGFGHTFWWSVAFTAVAIVPALALAGRPATSSERGRVAGAAPAAVEDAVRKPRHA